MIRLLYIVTLIVLVFSCKEKENYQVTHPDEEVVAIIQDLHTASALVSKYPIHERDSIRQLLKKEICTIHDLSVEELDVLLETVQESSKKYLELEKLAVENLNTIKDSLQKKKTESVVKDKSDESKTISKSR